MARRKMNKKAVIAIEIIVFALIELFFFILIKPRDLAIFFVIWALFHLIFMIYNIFNIRPNGAYIGVGGFGSGGDVTRYDTHVSAMNELTFGDKKDRLRTNKGIKDPLNLINLFFLAINIIAFIIFRS